MPKKTEARLKGRGGDDDSDDGEADSRGLASMETILQIRKNCRTFSQMGIRMKDLNYKEIGYYSIYGDPTLDYKELQLRADKNMLRKMSPDLEAHMLDKNFTVSFDLDDGKERQHRALIPFDQALPTLLRWIQENRVNQEIGYIRERLYRWWTNNLLIPVESLLVGVHAKGVVTHIKPYQVQDIPRLVKVEEDRIKQQLWNEEVVLGFLYHLFQYVIKEVTEDHKRVVYEITCAPNGAGGFKCKAVPAEKAVGHMYLPPNADDLIF